MNLVRNKTVSKLLKKDWPFTVKKVDIYCMLGTCVYCTINNEHFALNGYAHDKLKLKSILESKYHIEGKSITKYIEIGLNLFTDKERESFKSNNKIERLYKAFKK